MIAYSESFKDEIFQSIRSNKALLIDFDGTLLNYKINETKALLELFREIKLPSQVHAQALNEYKTFNEFYWRELELNKITIDEARYKGFEDLMDKYDLRGDPKKLNNQFLECLIRTTSIDNEILNSLKDLKSKGIKLIIITNGSHWSQSKRLKNSGLLNIIDTFFTSESVGYPKPHPKMFQDSIDFLESINCPTNNLWVIGDNLEADIRGGINAGFNTCWISNDQNETGNEEWDEKKPIPTITANNFLEFTQFYNELKFSS